MDMFIFKIIIITVLEMVIALEPVLNVISGLRTLTLKVLVIHGKNKILALLQVAVKSAGII